MQLCSTAALVHMTSVFLRVPNFFIKNLSKFCNSVDVQLVNKVGLYLPPASFDRFLSDGVQNPVPPRKTTCTAANLVWARA
jgi:hypothetical protein